MAVATKLFSLLLVVALIVGNAFAANTHVKDVAQSRSKRNVVNFGLMIKCATNRNPTDYNGYGCYCGMSGSGTPVDAVDSCCLAHDACWTRVKQQHSCQDGYFSVYKWKCLVDRPTECETNTDVCSRDYCMCDAEAAMCFARHRYTEYYRDWNGGCRRRSRLPEWARKVMQTIKSIPSSFIPHLGRVPGAAGRDAGAAVAPAARAPAPAQPNGGGPVMISLPGTGPDLPGNPAAGEPATAAAAAPAQKPRAQRPQPPKKSGGFSIPSLIGRILGGLPWHSVFGRK